jgi:hypothetical protein
MVFALRKNGASLFQGALFFFGFFRGFSLGVGGFNGAPQINSKIKS